MRLSSCLLTSSMCVAHCRFSPHAQAYHGEDQLDQLLSSPDFDAVVVVLPVQVLLHVAAKALKAGKHVFQEKPVGPTLSEVSTALNTYRNAGDMPLWAVAENYRCSSLAACWAACPCSILKVCLPDLPILLRLTAEGLSGEVQRG